MKETQPYKKQSTKLQFNSNDEQQVQIQSILINKICSDYNIFVFKKDTQPQQQNTQSSNSNKNNTKVANEPTLPTNKQGEEGDMEQNIAKKQENQQKTIGNKNDILIDYLKKYLVDKKYSQVYEFFILFTILFVCLCIIGPITLSIYLIYLFLQDGKNVLLKILDFIIISLFIISFNGYFYCLVIDSKEQFNINDKMFLINLQCLIQLIYILLALTSYIQSIIFFQFKFEQEGVKICNRLGIDMQRMQVEFIDGKKTEDFLDKENSVSILKFFRNREFQCLRLLEKMQNLHSSSSFGKNWNSAIELLNKLKLNEKNQNQIYNLITMLLIAVVYVFTIIYFKAEIPSGDYQKSKFSFMVINCFFYQVLLIFFQKIPKLVRSNLRIFKGLAPLLEIQNQNFSLSSINKKTSTLNLYCQYTIQSWASLHRLAIQLVHCFFQYLNVLQFMDIFIIIGLIFLVIVDLFGNLWQKNFIYNDREVFISIMINIGIRVSFTLFPIIHSFSKCSELLDYNKAQIRTMMRNLQRIKLEYYTLRKYLDDFTNHHLLKLRIDMNNISNDKQKAIDQITNYDFKNQVQTIQTENNPIQVEQQPSQTLQNTQPIQAEQLSSKSDQQLIQNTQSNQNEQQEIKSKKPPLPPKKSPNQQNSQSQDMQNKNSQTKQQQQQQLSQADYQPSEEILKDLIAIYEIKRNQKLYSHGDQDFYEESIKNFDSLGEMIKKEQRRELNYLTQLIKAYKYIHRDMEVKEHD